MNTSDSTQQFRAQTTVAVIGSGAAGLGAAWLLARGGYTVHLFESQSRAGGHANTVDIPIPNKPSSTIPVDTGFIVYNTHTYPDLVSLFELLGVEEENSSMSFASSVSLGSASLLEWGSDSLATVFADRANLYRPSMYTMLYDMYRFNQAVHEFVAAVEADASHPHRDQTLSQFLTRGSYSTVFIRAYIIPMVSAVWSASFNSALAFPARSLFRFFVNHGLAQIFTRPQWRTPAKRSRDYVQRLLDDFAHHGGRLHLSTPVRRVVRHDSSVSVYTNQQRPLSFHHVVFATHPPTTLAILGDDATDEERRVLTAFVYSTNTAYVHHDASLMPVNKTVWSAWNFINRQPSDTKTSQADTQEDQPSETESQSQQNDVRQPASEIETPTSPSNDSHSETSTVFTDVAERPSSFRGTEAEVPTPSSTPRTNRFPRRAEADPPSSTQSLGPDDQPVCVTYWLNRLQNFHKYHLPVPDLFLTLNPILPIDPDKKLLELSYDHPQFTEAAVRAQADLHGQLQGRNNTWFCGAYARYGFHEDALSTGLDVAELLSNRAILRPWKMKNHLAINNNARQYEFPLALLRAPMLVFVSALLILNAVLYRLQAGLGKIAARMSDEDPVVVVAVGDGRLHRFGPPRVRRRSRSFFSVKRAEELLVENEIPHSSQARVTVKNPRVLARITEALRQGLELAPTAAAAFAAAEIDCPSPEDLKEMLRALFIADSLDHDPSQARRGRAKLAENLLFSIVGDFKEVRSLSANTRLPELTTCMSNVVYPSWWLQVPDEQFSANQTNPSIVMSAVSPHDLASSQHALEILGDLSEITVALLRQNPSCRATIAVRTEERVEFVDRKADLLAVRDQITIVLLEQFLSQRKSGFGAALDLDQDITLFDFVVSPALLNNFRGIGFSSTEELFEFIKNVAAPGAIVELGATVISKITLKKRLPDSQGKSRGTHALFSGDKGFCLWKVRDIFERVENCNMDLHRVVFMDSDEAEEDVSEVIQRVYNSLATEKLEAEETRAVLAQMCLWQAALDVKYVRRMAVGLKVR